MRGATVKIEKKKKPYINVELYLQ